MNALLVIEDQVSLEIVSSNRIYHIGRILNKFGIRAIVMPQKRDLPKFLDGSKRIKKYFRRIWLFFRITYIVRKEKIKLILSRGFYMGLEGMLIAKIFGLKSVFDFHGFAWQKEIHKGYKYKQLLTKTLERICIKKSDFVIVQTKSNKNTIKDLNKNVIVLRNGVNLQEFTPRAIYSMMN